MAMDDPTRYNVQATFLDKEDKPGGCSWSYAASELLVDVVIDAKEVAAAAAAISNAVLKRITISYVLEDPVVDYTTADEASEVQRKTVAMFADSEGNPAKMEIPSPPGSIVVDGSDVLNPANAAVIAFIAKMTNSGVTPGIGPVSSHDLPIVKLTTPLYKKHRSSKRG